MFIVIGIGLLIFNIVDHATNHATKTAVRVEVTNVAFSTSDQVTITAMVTSLSSIPATVSCLVGVVLPSEPLAYPIRITEQLRPGQSVTVVVPRQLLKPAASQVKIQDIAFKCT